MCALYLGHIVFPPMRMAIHQKAITFLRVKQMSSRPILDSHISLLCEGNVTLNQQSTLTVIGCVTSSDTSLSLASYLSLWLCKWLISYFNITFIHHIDKKNKPTLIASSVTPSVKGNHKTSFLFFTYTSDMAFSCQPTSYHTPQLAYDNVS